MMGRGCRRGKGPQGGRRRRGRWGSGPQGETGGGRNPALKPKQRHSARLGLHAFSSTHLLPQRGSIPRGHPHPPARRALGSVQRQVGGADGGGPQGRVRTGSLEQAAPPAHLVREAALPCQGPRPPGLPHLLLGGWEEGPVSGVMDVAACPDADHKHQALCGRPHFPCDSVGTDVCFVGVHAVVHDPPTCTFRNKRGLCDHVQCPCWGVRPGGPAAGSQGGPGVSFADGEFRGTP